MSTQNNTITENTSPTKGMTRRRFLSTLLSTSAIAFMGSPLLMKVAHAAAAGTKEVLNGAHWGLFRAVVKDGRFVEAKPFEHDIRPTSNIANTPELVYSPSRIKYPMVRRGFLENGPQANTEDRGKGEFVRVTWDQAFELVAKELNRVRDTFGPAAIYGGSPGWKSVGRFHNCRAGLYRLLNMNGGYTKGVGDYSTGAAQVIMTHIMGNPEVYAQMSSYETVLEHTDNIILWGCNPQETLNMGWVIPDHKGFTYLDQLRDAGKNVISIDPLMTESAKHLNAKWYAPRPGSDTATMMAIAHELIKTEKVDEDFLSEFTVGYEELKAYVLGETDGIEKTPEWASELSELPASDIRDIAAQMANGTTMIMGGWSMQRADHGEQPHWMMVTLAAMLGQIGKPGGGFGYSWHYECAGVPSANNAIVPGLSGGKAPENMPPAMPVARITDALLNPGETIDHNGRKYTYPEFKLIYWTGGNPLSHQQDRNRMLKAWQRPETIIVQDIFWTASAKFADIVLPATTAFERNDMEMGGGASGKYLFPMHQVVEPQFESKNDLDIYQGIADKLGFGDKYLEGKSEEDWLRELYGKALAQGKAKNLEMPDFDEFWSNPTSYVEFPTTDEAIQYTRHGEFREDPLLEPLGTPSGLIEIYSKTVADMGYDDCKGHATWIEPAEWLGSEKAKQYPLHMLSPHPVERIHSQTNNISTRDNYTIAGREPVWISEEDASSRGIKTGDVVRVFNERGETLAGAYVTGDLRKGVIRLREGGWYDPEEPGKIGSRCKYGHANVLTIDKGASKLSQATIANTCLVDIAKLEGDAPTVTAFDAPKGA
ncbi:trimethylamine-N-oxide reductase (cytochrome c) [Pseudovibrio denitrificans]|uniref:trimethylamine-N-oxide reductase n=2 Tax=Pseudovibrio denitrificans TaxID=258256 RepID=A0A1I6Z611_9HYPH|nr:trimethylamine-N-oxide reductase TorA [Pseudovibrio denitrificans]SFT57851.1 trimethylamine-N-oxide reductase (cytochrome c) [Pseudovibrio denitrificans]